MTAQRPATVALLGRPNVGKSTLFNRLTGKPHAIVDDRPGATRDRREGLARVGGLSFTVIDTAGLEEAPPESLAGRMTAMSERAAEAADVRLLIVDGRAGVTPGDEHFANWLRRLEGPTLVAANKCEGSAGESGRLDAFALGLGEPIPLSA
ncbi:MAG: GTPase, partial [Pseudomonadota bacterium]